jgi:hypothetical protein
MTLKEKLKTPVMRLVDRALKDTDFPVVPDWLADPLVRSFAEALYDRYIDDLIDLISEYVDAEAE